MLIGFNKFLHFFRLDLEVRARHCQELKAFKKNFRNHCEDTVQKFVRHCGGAYVLRYLQFKTTNIYRKENLDPFRDGELLTCLYPIYLMNTKNDIIVTPKILAPTKNIYSKIWMKGNRSLGSYRAKIIFYLIQRCLYA